MTPIELVGAEWLGSLGLFLGFILLVRYLDHRERMAMIARGFVPSRAGRGRARRSGSAVLRGGLITAMVGLAVTFALYSLGYLLPPPFNAAPGGFGPWLLPGLIPLFVGLALIASHYLTTSPDVSGALRPRSDEATTPTQGQNDELPAETDAGHPPRSADGPAATWRVLGGESTASDLDEQAN
jgi:Domain of unknown function (DUF6249)